MEARGSLRGSRGERIGRVAERRQGEGESIAEFENGLLDAGEDMTDIVSC